MVVARWTRAAGLGRVETSGKGASRTPFNTSTCKIARKVEGSQTCTSHRSSTFVCYFLGLSRVSCPQCSRRWGDGGVDMHR
jgi:hypothetical protein